MIRRALLLAFTVLFSAGQTHAQSAGSWPMFRGNAAHHGRSTSVGPELPSIRWTHPLRRSSYSSPAVGPDGTIYVGSADALYAISPDGQLRWSAPLDDFSISSPAVGRTMVYSGSTSGTLYAFALETGLLQWSFATGDEIWSSPTLGPDGTVYVTSSDNTVYAIDASEGAELWRYVLTTDLFSSPALSGGVLCAVDQDGAGVLLNVQDGSLRRAFLLQTEVVSSPAFGPNGLVVAASTGGVLYGIDAESGGERWQASLGGEIVSSPAMGINGTVYIGSSSGSLFAVNAADGTVRWSTQLGDEIYGSPLLDAANRLYVGTIDSERTRGSLTAVDAVDGSILWSLPAESPVWSSAAITGSGTLYIATAGDDELPGELLAIELTDVGVDPAEEPVAGTAFDVAVTTSSSFTPTSGTLFYRRGGERNYEAVDVAPQGDGFLAVVPAPYVTERGLEYHLSMSDGEVTRTYPATNPAGRPIVQRVRVPNAQLPISLLPRRYHMVSVPLEAETRNPSDVLTDDYGPYNPTVWRLFRWSGEDYAEFPDLDASFAPGTAFFLAHRSGAPFDVAGRSVDTSEPAVVTLEPGWNQVAVPFAFPVYWESISTADPSRSNDVREIAFYDGVEMIQNVDDFNPLQPWAGYFIRNASPQPLDILFPNEEGIESRQDEVAARMASSAGRQTADYELRLEAVGLSDNLRDTQNWVGFRADATDREDDLDLREAPPFGEHVRLSVVESEARFARSYRSPSGVGGAWSFELSASPSAEQTIEVQLTEVGQLPAHFQIVVIDEDRDRTVGLIEKRFRIDVTSGTRHLTVAIGTTEYTSSYLRDVAPHATAFFLDGAFPNPFRNSTSIRYGIEHAADVLLEVFDVMGRRIATLTDGSHDAGRYEIEWSGVDSAGRPVANGVYFYRLRAGDRIATRQAVLSR